MEDKLALILKNAFLIGRLRGTFVHLTHEYFHPEHQRGYGASAILMEDLRKKGVPIVHVLERTIDNKEQISHKEAKKLQLRDRPIEELSPRKGDKIFPHKNMNGFRNDTAAKYFNSISKPVVIGAGIFSDICFQSTMAGFLERTEKSRVIVAQDCLEEPLKLSNFSEEHQGRVLEATAAEILGILAMTNPR